MVETSDISIMWNVSNWFWSLNLYFYALHSSNSHIQCKGALVGIVVEVTGSTVSESK